MEPESQWILFLEPELMDPVHGAGEPVVPVDEAREPRKV